MAYQKQEPRPLKVVIIGAVSANCPHSSKPDKSFRLAKISVAAAHGSSSEPADKPANSKRPGPEFP